MTTCKSCGAHIIWAETEKGKSIPLDPPEKRFVGPLPGRIMLVDTYQAHFVTCTDPEKHREADCPKRGR